MKNLVKKLNTAQFFNKEDVKNSNGEDSPKQIKATVRLQHH